MLRDRGLVQVSSPCDEEQLVVDVHAVLLGLVARVHVEAASEAVVEATVLLVGLGSGNDQAGGRSAGGGGYCERREGVYPFDAIVTIGAALVRMQAGRELGGVVVGADEARRRSCRWCGGVSTVGVRVRVRVRWSAVGVGRATTGTGARVGRTGARGRWW